MNIKQIKKGDKFFDTGESIVFLKGVDFSDFPGSECPCGVVTDVHFNSISVHRCCDSRDTEKYIKENMGK